MRGDIETAVWSVSECAKVLRLSKGSMYQAIATGQIPHLKIGRRILIPRIALERMLNEAGKPKES